MTRCLNIHVFMFSVFELSDTAILLCRLMKFSCNLTEFVHYCSLNLMLEIVKCFFFFYIP